MKGVGLNPVELTRAALSACWRAKSKFQSVTCGQLGCDLMRMKIGSPEGRPQIVSFVPLEKRLVWTTKAYQLVSARLVWNSGKTLHVSVPVERSVIFVLRDRPTMRMVGGGAEDTVVARLPNPWIEHM